LVASVFIIVAYAFWKGGWQLVFLGLSQAGRLIDTVWLRLLLGFTLGGLVQVLMPAALIAKLLGRSSGLKGILLGSYIGIIMGGGGPFVSLPIIASIYRAGAGVGPVIALLTGVHLLGLRGLIAWQIPFLGTGIPLARYIVCLFATPLVGLVGEAVFKAVTRPPQVANNRDDSFCNMGQQQDGTGKTCEPTAKEEAETWT
ncbi:permease, partial [Chloroflexota bacterium]